MSAGVPLTDEDRAPWLALIRSTADRLADSSQTNTVVIACSALKRSYRDILRGTHPAADELPPPSDIPSSHPVPGAHEPGTRALRTYFVFIDGPREVLLQRMSARKGHFMKEKMLDSQIATLERPSAEELERDVVIVDLERGVEEQVKQAVWSLASLRVLFGGES